MEAVGRWITSKHRHIFIGERQKVLDSINKNFGRFNCQACVVAYEACMRGYDVSVDENNWDNPIINLLARRPEIAYQDLKTGHHPIPIKKSLEDYKQGFEFLQENLQKNARYELACKLKISEKYGHILCIEKTKEGFRIIEPQNGTMSHSQKEIEQYLKLIDYSYPVTLLRVDNVKFTPQFLEFIKGEQL